MLVNLSDMLRHAHRHGYAVGSFPVLGLDFVEGILAAAEDRRSPVILALAEPHLEPGRFELLMGAVERAAERAAVPVAIHCEQGASLESAIRAINLGCTGVMVDTDRLPLEHGIARAREVVDMAHGCGIPVEGRFGSGSRSEEEIRTRGAGEPVPTLVEAACRYAAETGVDFLALSVDAVADPRRGEARSGSDYLGEINQSLNLPLATDGDPHLAAGVLERLIGQGIAKVDFRGPLDQAAAGCILANGREHPGAGLAAQVGGLAEAVRIEVERCIGRCASAGRATALLSDCRPWQPVEHLIIYNVEGLDDTGLARMMADGRRILGGIPGVRRVFTGTAVKADAGYRCCWLVRFCNAAVIESYRDHPHHQAFADERFRPYAGGRISIDYLESVPAPEGT